MITVREATIKDSQAISAIFKACYGDDYAYPQFYDLDNLNKMIYSDDTLLLVAEEDGGNILGTASVIYEIGANSDLVGEFGRLAVHPDARNKGAGKLLMQERLKRVEKRLQVGLIDGRVVHPYTQKIAEKQGFSVVGFLPLKMLLNRRESVAIMVRYFGNALELRNNHPRLIPEVYSLAAAAMESLSMPFDGIIDEEAGPYTANHDFELDEISTRGYSLLLRMERGRVKNREIFGPMRLHYGLFKVQAGKAQYLIAKESGQIAGAVGFTLDPVEKAVRIIELIALHDDVIHFLLHRLEELCRTEWEIAFIEADVSAYAPRMQRTLLSLDFMPAAYVPALVFHEVERLDVIKMVRLLVPLDLGDITLSPATQYIADIVLKPFQNREIMPQVAKAVKSLELFDGLNDDQITRLASICTVKEFAPGDAVFEQEKKDNHMYVVLEGEVEVTVGDRTVGVVKAGECLGEIAFLTRAAHSATAYAKKETTTAVIAMDDFSVTVRQRPDIGLLIYRNLAYGLGEKLRRSDTRIPSKT